jgi:hypothetical protein
MTNKMGFGLDLLTLLLQSLVITINYNNSTISLELNPSSLTAEDSPHSCSYFILFFTTYIGLRQTQRKHIYCPAMDICKPHRKDLLQQWFCCCMHIVWALPRNWSALLLVEYLLRACLLRCSLTLGVHVTMLQPSFLKQTS